MLEPPDNSPLVKGMNRKKRDMNKARELFDQGCNLQEGESCVLAAQLSLADKNFAKAISYYERACDSCSLVKGCRQAAVLYLKGLPEKNIQPNKDKSNEYKKKMEDLLPIKFLNEK